MEKEVSYWVASHLTGLFEIRDKSPNLLHKGSRGAGLSINRGVTTSGCLIENKNPEIYFEGKKKSLEEAKVTMEVITRLFDEPSDYNLRIEHNFEVPMGSGFGASAAGALGTAFTLNKLLKLNLSEIELFQIAHCAEVQTKSGLGDVIGLYRGGLELRVKEGAPGYGETRSLINQNDWKIATIHFGPLSTAEILTDPHKRKAVNEAGSKLINDLIANPNFSDFIHLSNKFTQQAKLWSNQVKKCIESLPKSVIGSQIMLGEALFLFYQDNDILDEIKIQKNRIKKETVCQKTILRKK